MEKLNADVTAYINQSADFAKPILEHWRTLIHKHCPGVVEAVKWGYPHFDYKGDHMFVIAAYKNHCSFSFIKAELMSDPRLKGSKDLKAVQRFMGKITGKEDLPSDKEFVGMLKEAMKLNEAGVKVVRPKSDKPTVLETPDYLVEILKANPKAKEIFDSKSNSFRKEYIVWISDAKTAETRQKRIDEALEWIAEGKGRFWKHKK
jgi:uncharacterized protein YdeI (YjbR/CyaY-like superfamily)